MTREDKIKREIRLVEPSTAGCRICPCPVKRADKGKGNAQMTGEEGKAHLVEPAFAGRGGRSPLFGGDHGFDVPDLVL